MKTEKDYASKPAHVADPACEVRAIAQHWEGELCNYPGCDAEAATGSCYCDECEDAIDRAE